MLGICTVLSVAASSVEWRCSTEGSTWQLEVLPPQNRDHDEAPNPICNPIPNLDCWGQLNHKKFSEFPFCCHEFLVYGFGVNVVTPLIARRPNVVTQRQ